MRIIIIALLLLIPSFAFAKTVILNDSGLVFNLSTDETTVDNLLKNNFINLSPKDAVYPSPETKLCNGMTISVHKAKKIILTDGIEKKEIEALSLTVADVLSENGIRINEYDILEPAGDIPVSNNEKIKITRVKIEEKTASEDIPFEKIVKEDDELSWRTLKTEQSGIKGANELTYEIISHNGKEIARKILSKIKIKDPVPEIKIQGTYVKTSGKAHTGLGTWYAFKGGLFAASPWLPMGSYAKVTNKENGKSVIVRINDRGPFGENRIIDLDKVAFAKIASLGAGVIDVKVEEILN